MNDLLAVVRWIVREPYRRVRVAKEGKNGKTRYVSRLVWQPEPEGALPLHEKTNFVEQAVLCGFQMAQRMAGISEYDPKFVVDIRIERTMKLKSSTTKLLGWHIFRKDGTREYERDRGVSRKKWKDSSKPQTKTRSVKKQRGAQPS